MLNYILQVNQNNRAKGLWSMRSVSPVFTPEDAHLEYEIAKNQPEYEPVIGLKVTLQVIDPDTNKTKEFRDWAIAMRFRLTEEERAAIAAGHDLVVTQLVFGKSLSPMNFQLCAANEKPVFIQPEVVGVVEAIVEHESAANTRVEPDESGPFLHKWEPDFSEGEPASKSKICGICGREDDKYHGTVLPSAADLDADAQEKSIADATGNSIQ
jgi:hypothetical protein